jgi:NAD(P)-dependent dehydrogenase (short-subunit alcohol dehydrogenase family)
MNTNILEGKVVVVTGAASGIGKAVAIQAARHGARAIIVSDLVEEPREGGRSTVEEITDLGVSVRFHRADVSQRADVDALVEAAREFGGIDVMVANAGITAKADGYDVTEEDFQRLMRVNLDGTLFSAQAAARQMKSIGKAGRLGTQGPRCRSNGSLPHESPSVPDFYLHQRGFAAADCRANLRRSGELQLRKTGAWRRRDTRVSSGTAGSLS